MQPIEEDDNALDVENDPSEEFAARWENVEIGEETKKSTEKEPEQLPSVKGTALPEDEATEVINNKSRPKRNHWQGVLVLGVHFVFVALAVVSHFIFEWANEPSGAAWALPTSEAVVEHMKMLMWPWLVLLVPFDLLSKWYMAKQAASSEPLPPVSIMQTTWYMQKIHTTSVLVICQAHMVALSSAMLFVAGVFRLYTWLADVEHNLPADIVTFMVAACMGPVLRLWLLEKDRIVGWMLVTIYSVCMIGFFVYVTYEANVHEGFWLDSHSSD